MIVDWTNAPEDCVGALVAKVGNSHFPKVTFVRHAIFEHGRVRGDSCEGLSLCAYLDVWAWEGRPWTGEGLPPIGTDAEFKGHDGVWRPGTYIGQFNGKMVVGCHETGVVGFLSSEEFRPIRTPEQIAAEERLAAINYMEIDAGMCATAFDGDPEVRVWVENLIDKGWRKQVPE